MTALVFASGPLAGRRFEVDRELSIGRAWGDIAAEDPELSRRHALVRPVTGGLLVEDLGSTNGTWVDGVRIVAPTRVGAGSSIAVGQSQATVEAEAEAEVPAEAPAGAIVTNFLPNHPEQSSSGRAQRPDHAVPGAGGAAGTTGLPGPGGRRLRRAKWYVLGVWLIVLAGVGIALGGKLPTVTNSQVQSDDALPSSAQSAQVGRLLKQFPGGQQHITLLVFERSSGLTAPDRARILPDARLVSGVAYTAAPEVPYTPGAAAQLVAANGRVAIMVIPLTTDDSSDRDKAVKRIRELVGTGSGGLKIQLTGPAAIESDFNTAVAGANAGLLAATVGLVLILLLAIYRSPIAAVIPLVVVGIAYAVAQGLVYVYARLTHTVVDRTALTLLAVLMFGAGTDYCLLLVSRYTADLREVDDPHEAMAGALSRTWHAIVASGATVAAAMLTFFLSSLKTNHILAPVNAIGILTVMVAGITLLPALLLVIGRRAFWPNRRVAARHARAQTGVRDSASALGETPGFWFRLATRVTRRPAVALSCALAIFAVGALGLLDFHEKVSVTNDFRVQPDSIRGLALLSDGFPEGAIYPETVLLRRTSGPVTDADAAYVATLIRRIPGIASVSGIQRRSRDGELATVSVVYAGDPFSDAALARAQRLRDVVAHPEPTLTGLVGEGTSARLDYKNAVNRDTKVIVPAVLLVIFIALVLLLRALVAPLYLLATVVVSYLGSLGFSVFFIREVLGQSLDPFYPLITFVFLVALGVDYNIFLMSRVREEALTHDTPTALLRALVATGPVITSAGLILAGTFAALTTLPLWILLEIGLTVALGVLLDTFVVRTIAVPAIVRLVGDASWWPSSARGGRSSPLVSETFRDPLIERWRAPAGE